MHGSFFRATRPRQCCQVKQPTASAVSGKPEKLNGLQNYQPLIFLVHPAIGKCFVEISTIAGIFFFIWWNYYNLSKQKTLCTLTHPTLTKKERIYIIWHLYLFVQFKLEQSLLDQVLPWKNKLPKKLARDTKLSSE